MLRFVILLLTGPLIALTARAAEQKTIEDEIRGAGFGFGVGAVYMFGDKPIDTVSIDSAGLVRGTEKSSARVGAILEAHYLMGGLLDRGGGDKIKKALNALTGSETKKALEEAGINPQEVRPDFVNGPMVIVELGENIVRSFGVGWMWSWRRYTISLDSNEKINSLKRYGTAFNLGFCGLIEPKVKTLPGGFQLNKAAPTGFTTVSLEEKERFGAALTFSATF